MLVHARPERGSCNSIHERTGAVYLVMGAYWGMTDSIFRTSFANERVAKAESDCGALGDGKHNALLATGQCIILPVGTHGIYRVW